MRFIGLLVKELSAWHARGAHARVKRKSAG
jgi:hypothetical protein